MIQRAKIPADKQPFDLLATAHINWVYGLARRQLGDANLADDATQAVFIALWRKYQRLAAHNRPIGGWLLRATHYACENIQKGERRRKNRERKVANMRHEETHPVVGAAEESNSLQLLALDAAMHKLSTGDHDVLVARFFQNQSARQMAQAFNISEAAAEKRITRAVIKLRGIMAQKNIAMDSTALVALLASGAGTAPNGLLAKVLQGVSGNAPVSLTATHAARSIAFHTAHIPAVAGAAAVALAVSVAAVAPMAMKIQHTSVNVAHAAPKSPIPIGYATTRLTGPLNKDGLVDYVAAFNQRFGHGVTPKNNAAVPLLILGRPQTFLGYHMSFKRGRWTSFVYPEKNWGKAYRRALGISQADLAGLKYVRFWIFCRKADKSAIPHIHTAAGILVKPPPQVPQSLGSVPWSARANPWVAAWLAVNGGVWDVAAAATRRPRLFIPLCPRPGKNRSMAYTESETLMMTNLLGLPLRGLMFRAMLELHRGQIQSCEADLLAAHRLIALLPQEHISRFSFFDGFSPKMLCGAEVSLAKYGRLSASQLLFYLHRISRFHAAHVSARDENTTDRWEMLSMLQIAAKTGDSAELAGMGFPISPQGRRWKPAQCVKAAKLFNHLQDQLVAALKHKHILASATAISSLESAWRRTYRGTHVAWAVVSYFTTMQAFITTPDARSAARWRIVRLVLALAAYRDNAGRFPVRLAALTPKYIAVLPHDPFTGKRFKYVAGPTGCTISSPGEFPPAINPGEAAFQWQPITVRLSQTVKSSRIKQ